MDRTKVYSLNDNPALIVKSVEARDKVVVLSLTKTEELCTAGMEEIAVSDLRPYKCPYAEEKDPARFYCEDSICKYVVPETAPFATLTNMCMRCLMKSFEEELGEESGYGEDN